MEAVTPPNMPSQAQMAYAQRASALHRTSHAQPSTDLSASPFKQRLPLSNPPLPYAPANTVRFVPHYGNTQLYRPPFNTHMIVRENISSRLDPNSHPSTPSTQLRQRLPHISSQTYLTTSPAHSAEHGIVIGHSSVPIDLNNPPAKKIRLSDSGPLLKSELITPLRIETREHGSNTSSGPGSVYKPEVEAISPTLPEDASLKATKDELISKIGKVDGDISVADAIIKELKEKEKSLEEALKKISEERTELCAPSPAQTKAQIVYAKNKDLVSVAHGQLEKLGPPIDLPMYNQPMDTKVYQENNERHSKFKAYLKDHIRKKKLEESARQTRLTETYCSLANSWFKKVDKVENSNKRKAREQKSRDVFEKMFPEIRKNREDKERFSRVGSRIKSDADLAEIMDGLQEQEAEDRRRHSLSVIPPIIFDRNQRKVRFINVNGRVLDYQQELEDRTQMKMWTQQEREIFREKYIHHQKNFGLIASFLERKTPSDCVEYYYLSKKKENYKRAIRYNKSRARTRGGKNLHKSNHVNSLNNSLGALDPIFNNTGVTTRLQREQLIKQEQPNSSNNSRTQNDTKDRDKDRGGGGASSDAGTTPIKDEPCRNTPTPTTTGGAATPTTASCLPSTSTTGGLSATTTVTTSSSSSTSSSQLPSSSGGGGGGPPSSGASNNSACDNSSQSTYSHSVLNNVSQSNSSNLSNSSSTATSNSSSVRTMPCSISSSVVTSLANLTSGSAASSLSSSSDVKPNVGAMSVNNNNTMLPLPSSSSSSHLHPHSHHVHPGSGATSLSSSTSCAGSTTTSVAGTTASSSCLGSNLYISSSSNATLGFAGGGGNAPPTSSSSASSGGCVVSSALNSSNNSILPNHHLTATSTGELRLEIKKKERRKDDKKKEGEFLDDTSDDELLDTQESEKLKVPHECHICRKEVTSSRPLQRSHASQYGGLTEDDIPPNARVCPNCRALRNRFTCCPIPSCVNHTTSRAKRLRLLPSKFHSLPSHVKMPIANEFQISASITKCCSLCFTRIQKKLMTMGIGGSSEDASSRPSSPNNGSTSPLLRWSEEETELLRKGLRECGTKWTEVSAIVGSSKTSHQCKSFYMSYRKSLGLDVLVEQFNKTHFGTERKPALTDEEESGSSTSSCDGLIGSSAMIDSDTASAPSPSLNPTSHKPLCPPRISESSDTTTSRATPTRPGSNQAPVTKEDYDSSATETADEGTAEQSTNSPLTVKDLMLGVIEISLKNNNAAGSSTHGGEPNSQNSKANPPTISSILKTSETMSTHKDQLLTVTSNHLPPPQSKPPPMMVVSQASSMHAQHREAEPVTLDLSIKKPRLEPQFPNNAKPPPATHSLHPPVSVYRPAPDAGYYQQVMDAASRTHASSAGGNGPSSGGPPNEVYATSPHLIMSNPNHSTVRSSTPSHMKSNTKVRMTSLSPSHQANRVSPSQCKISVMQHASSPRPHPGDRYGDPTMHHPMKESPGGSITQGTPVHSRIYSAQPNSNSSEFMGRPSPNPAHRASEPLPQPRSSSNPPSMSSSPFYPPRAPGFAVTDPQLMMKDQQQILMNDYLTSKMLTVASTVSRRSEKPSPSPITSSSAAAAMFYPPARQGVIQRHNTSKPPSPHFPPPPGHEAFSSLVETAVRQPSLPVPDHKSSAAEIHDKRMQSLHEGLNQRFNNHDRYAASNREHQERFARESQHQAQQQQVQREQREREQQAREREQKAREREHQQAAQQQQLMQREREVAVREQQILRDREMQKIRDQALLHEHQMLEIQRREQAHMREQQQKQQMLRETQMLQQQAQAAAQQQQQAAAVAAAQAQQRERELLHMRERELLVARNRLNPDHHQQQRIHQIHMAAFQQQQQHHAAAVQAAAQRERVAAAAVALSNSGGAGDVVSQSDRESHSRKSASSGSSNSDKHSQETRPQLVTAASLIDAIITHQINQPVDQAGPGERGHLPNTQPGMMNPAQVTRPGDRLFQVDFNQKKTPSPLDQSNGKVSPAGSSSMVGRSQLCSPDSKTISVNDHLDSMLSRNTPNAYEQQQAWKLRRALQQKDEEVQRSQSHVLKLTGQMSPKNRYYGDPASISPLEYMKSRIAEVMRTSEDDKGGLGGSGDPSEEHPHERPIYSPASYIISSSSPRPPSRPTLLPPPSNTPSSMSSMKGEDASTKSLMSDQYEPLSDDD